MYTRPLGETVNSLQLLYLTATAEVGNAEAVGDTACDTLCLTPWKTGAD